MLKISRSKLESPSADVQCDFCGFPIDLQDPNPMCYEIEDLEHLAFCSRSCAVEFLQDAEYDMSDSSTEGGYVIP